MISLSIEGAVAELRRLLLLLLGCAVQVYIFNKVSAICSLENKLIRNKPVHFLCISFKFIHRYQCERKETFIQQIQCLEIDTQAEIALCIQEVSTRMMYMSYVKAKGFISKQVSHFSLYKSISSFSCHKHHPKLLTW